MHKVPCQLWGSERLRCCPSNNFSTSVEHIHIYKLYLYPSSHNDPYPSARCSNETHVNRSLVIDFTRVRDLKNRRTLHIGVAQKAREAWRLGGQWGALHCSNLGCRQTPELVFEAGTLGLGVVKKRSEGIRRDLGWCWKSWLFRAAFMCPLCVTCGSTESRAQWMTMWGISHVL